MKHIGWTLVLAGALAGGCGGSSAEEPEEMEHTGGEADGHHEGGHHEGGHHEDGHHEDGHHEEGGAPEATRVLEDGSHLYGGELDASRETTPLATIVAEPSRFEGQVVKTEGEITQVCQRRGCWMELRADADSPGIRVPMAGHSFFLPRDVSGHRATIEGTVVVAALSEEDRAHLESEGAQAADQELSIEATGVIVHP
jgi:hypothetical protein